MYKPKVGDRVTWRHKSGDSLVGTVTAVHTGRSYPIRIKPDAELEYAESMLALPEEVEPLFDTIESVEVFLEGR